MLAVLKHELRNSFNSLTFYLFCAAFLLFVGVGAMLYNIQKGVANFEYVLSFVRIGLVVIIPVLTMKSFAEERKQKTDQLLYSLPLKTYEVVLGKYLSLVIMFLIPMLIVAIYPYIFSKYGDVYLPNAYGSWFAFFLMGAALIAVGMFISSLTDNQGFAAGISIVLFLFNYYSVTLAEQVSTSAIMAVMVMCIIEILIALAIKFITKSNVIAYISGAVMIALTLLAFWIYYDKFESLLPNIMKNLSLFERFTTFVNGVFDMTGIIFYLSVIVLGVFLTIQSLEKRRYN